MTARRVEPDAEDGAVTVFFAVLALALLLVIGLVADGGAKVRASSQAYQIAAEAARAGGQAIDLDSLASSGGLQIDRSAAVQTAQAHLRAVGADGEVSLAASGTELTVEVHVSKPTAFLSLIGIRTVTGTGNARAVLVHELHGG